MITSAILSAIFYFFLAVVFACIEIESEGKYGWAEKMPTWYRKSGLISRLYGLAMGGKPLTGYHAFMFFLPILVFHSHFFRGVDWTMREELLCWALYFAWCPLWDYLWFVLNPHYRAGYFRKENVWWHAGSMWIFNRLPLDHVMGWVLSMGFACGAAYWGPNDLALLKGHIVFLGMFVVLTVATILVAPLYHIWYRHMRSHDERAMVAIEHRLPKDQWLLHQ